MDALNDELRSLRKENAALRDALEPFTALLQDHNDKGADERPVFGINDAVITLGDLRRARAALQGAKDD